MAYFMLFNVPKNLKKEDLQKQLCTFGELRFFSLKEDTKDNRFMFAQVDYITLDKKDAMLKYLSSHKINCSKEKPSKNNNQKTICNNSNQKIQNDISNPSFYYYKDNEYGKYIEEFKLKNNYEELFKIENAEPIELTTVYPGLLIGSGYNHPKDKNSDEDYQLGFFFDHTTGLPIISGSSIKGLIKSVYENKELMKDFYNQDVTNKEIDTIFNGGVTFYDAYILKTENKNNKIFGDDYITSHHSDKPLGEFKAPNPIRFLKILPNVTFKFQFSATKEQVKLFEQILLDFGIGAKTNVGYGQFVNKADFKVNIEELKNSFN